MKDRFLAWFGIYWYKFTLEKVYGFYLEEARAKLFTQEQRLVDTNDPSII